MWVQLSPRVTTTEPLRSGALALQLEHLWAAKKIPCATAKTRCKEINKYFLKVNCQTLFLDMSSR